MGKIWTFEYEPKTINEMIVDTSTKSKLIKIMEEKPNVLLHGPPGVGKGTFTNIFLRETKLDHLKINCSDETGIDNLREKVKVFATSLGNTNPKIVVLNESDFISLPGQAMLRDLIERVQEITRFILCCNYPHKIIKELISRCQVVELSSPPAKEIYKHCAKILNSEKVRVKSKEILIDTIKKLYPDIRLIINTLQYNTVNNKISNINVSSNEDLYKTIFVSIKNQDINELWKLLKSETIDYSSLYEYLFENVTEFKTPGDAVILIGEYMYKDNFVSIKMINFMAMVMRFIKEGVV